MLCMTKIILLTDHFVELSKYLLTRNQGSFHMYNQALWMSVMLKFYLYFTWDLDPITDFANDFHLNESGYQKIMNKIVMELNV